MLTVRLINHRNPHVSMLALALLDTLVQACGYPFHLQVGTKEFLNELVRRFPERPPPFPGPVMTRILELIHTWKETICTDSRWKEDLGNIRDMHRLLTFKGYRFRETSRTNIPSASVSCQDKTFSPSWERALTNICNVESQIRRGARRRGQRSSGSEATGTNSPRNPERPRRRPRTDEEPVRRES